jgi:hypothetical protein
MPETRLETELADDLKVIESFQEKRRSLSRKAGQYKRWFSFSQWIIVMLSVVVVALGAAQTGLGGNNTPLIIAEAVLSAFVAAIVLLTREMDVQRRWLYYRYASEQMKSEFSLFLGRVGEYGETDDPRQVLYDRLLDIETDLKLKIRKQGD